MTLISNRNTPPRKSLMAFGVMCALLALALLSACSASPTKPDAADSLRSRLTQLQSDPELASRAPLAIKDADIAVSAAEKPQADKAAAAHLVFMADRPSDANAELPAVLHSRGSVSFDYFAILAMRAATAVHRSIALN